MPISPFALQPATMGDIPHIMQFISEAQQHLKSQGIDQWQDGYPNATAIASDIAAQQGYLILLHTQDTASAAIIGQPIGYLCVDFSGEPAYATLTDGEWHADAPYATIHRMTIGDAHKGKGFALRAFSLADTICANHGISNLRIDTHPDNHKMQYLLAKHGFTLCGRVFYPSGVRLAYDKIISSTCSAAGAQCHK